jgi:ribosomal protein S18 acetylase RimI-like enzyme
MSVDASCRRQGIGSALIQHLLAFAATQGHTRVFLTTTAFNAPGIAMYEKAGFRLTRTFQCEGDFPVPLILVELEYLVPQPPPSD